MYERNPEQGQVLVSIEPDQREDDEVVEENEDVLEEGDWRVYLDLYGFLPLSTTGDITINGNTATIDSSLADILATVTGIFTGRFSVEYGRLGFMAGFIYGTLSEDQSGTNSFDGEKLNPPIDGLNLNSQSTTDFNQSAIDLALRYRAGAIEQPVMKTGDSTFIGFVGTRIIDACMDIDMSLSADVKVNGRTLTKKEMSELEKSASGSIVCTWAQPLLGLQVAYAMSPEWHAFMRLDAGGFGLSGKKDLSVIAQAGLAYTVGNSAQLSLSWKYFGL